MRKTLFVLLCSFALISLISCQAQTASGEVGSKAPDFTLRDLSGDPYSLADTRGKVVILDFWATWCPPCRMEIPHFVALQDEYGSRGLQVIGVALDRGGVSAVKSFAAANGINYKVLIGDQNVTSAYGGIRGIPTTFIIDRKGIITQKATGYRDKAFFEDAIRDLI